MFKVPRYGLPGDGAAFDAMFVRGPGATGSSDEDPIRLDADVTSSDFRSMLKATYPPYVRDVFFTSDRFVIVKYAGRVRP